MPSDPTKDLPGQQTAPEQPSLGHRWLSYLAGSPSAGFFVGKKKMNVEQRALEKLKRVAIE